MNKRNIKQLLLAGSTLMVLGACSTREVQESTPTPEEEVEEVDETEVVEEGAETEENTDVEAEEEEAEEEPPTSDVGKRSNPVPVGESVTYTEVYYGEDWEEEYEAEYEVRITDIVRGEEALTILKEENQFNEPAPEGMEWAIITLEGTLHAGDEDVPYTVVPWFSVVDSTGSEVPQDDYATLDGNEYGYVDLFPGGTTEGRIAHYMPVDDESLLFLDDMMGSGIYFSLTPDSDSE